MALLITVNERFKVNENALINESGAGYTGAVGGSNGTGGQSDPGTSEPTRPAGVEGEIQFNNAGIFGADSALFWDNQNKRLGIGTNSPLYKLQINAPDEKLLYLLSDDNDSPPIILAGTPAAITWQIGNSGQFGDDFTISNYNIGSIFFALNEGPDQGTATAKIIFQNDGKIGVNVLTPQADIDILNTIRIRGGSPQAGYVWTADDNTGDGSWQPAPGGSTTNPAGSDGQIQFNNAGIFGADSALFWDNQNKRLGIGTTSPVDSIEVENGNILLYGNGGGYYVRVSKWSNEFTQYNFFGVSINRAGGYFENTFSEGTIFIRTNNGAGQQLRVEIGGDKNLIQFFTHNGVKLIHFGTTSNNPRLQFHDSAGNDSTILYENPVYFGGTYGSLVIDDGATNGYEGYSIGGRVVFMHDNNVTYGLYDDVNNRWHLRLTIGGGFELYHSSQLLMQSRGTGGTDFKEITRFEAVAAGFKNLSSGSTTTNTLSNLKDFTIVITGSCSGAKLPPLLNVQGGQMYQVHNFRNATVTIAADGSETILKQGSAGGSGNIPAYYSAFIVADRTGNAWYMATLSN